MTMPTMPLPPGMGQCSVTGKIVPQDELVTIHGQQVCAEGKAILLDRLRAGETAPGEQEKPSVWKRFVAIFLDGLIINVPFAILNAVVLGSQTTSRGLPGPNANVMAGALALLSAAASLFYFGAMHAAKGQTVGKMAAGLRVVNNDDSTPITSQASYVRAIAYIGPAFLSAIATFTGVLAAVSIAGVVALIWGLVDLIMALVDGDRQRSLHDRIANTRVITK